ncbi:MAG: hypothetical protein CMM93_01785 [Rickettsiales bacterium]|nr:hypothetical protein [Rickettsiales bacterium]
MESIITINNEIKKLGGVNKKNPEFFINTRNREIVNIKTIIDLNAEYNKYIGIREAGDNNTTSLYHGFTGKEGIIRARGDGKVVSHNIARAVIACKPDIPMDIVYLPKSFAETMYVKVTVTPYNIDLLKYFVRNQENYPGCKRIYSYERGNMILNDGTYSLKYKDVVYRHMIDGDEVLLGRSPSLNPTSISCHKIRVHKGKKPILNIGINVLPCKAYNADFDGDEMVLKSVNSEEARAECAMLFSFDRYSNQFENGGPIIGLAQDSIMGIALLTNAKTKLSRYEAMNILSNVPVKIKFEKEVYAGREIFSMVLPPIDYDQPSPMFAKQFIKQFGQFDESDYRILIERGELKSGVVCGNAVKEKPGSIYHIISNNISKKAAMDTIFYHQQIAHKFLELFGSTISYRDIDLGKDSRKLIDLVKSTISRELSEFYNLLINGNITPPTGTNMKDYVHSEISRILKSDERFLMAIMKTIDPSDNWIFTMVSSGTKGSYDNIINILATLGLKKINGKLLPPTLGDYRHSIHAKQFSDDPEDLGYVHSALIDGINPKNILPIGRETRSNIITKGLEVSTAGYKGKEVGKSMESMVVDHRLFTVRGYGTNIIELNSTDDGFKSSSSQSNVIESIMMSDDEIKKVYSERANLVKRDRETMFRIFENLQNGNPSYKFSNKIKLPIDVNQIIKNTIPESKGNLKENVKILEKYLEDIHYLRINQVHRAKRTKLPESIIATFTLLKIAIRSHFKDDILVKYNEDQLQKTLSLISFRITDAFFEPGDPIGILMAQSFSAPLTQYLIDAHHASASGGTSKDGMNYCMDIIQHRPVKSSKTNLMYIYLKPEFEDKYENAKALANFITLKSLKSFLQSSMIVYEKIGVHETYPEDKESAAKYIKDNRITYTENDLYPIHFRFVLDKEKMDLKYPPLDDLFNKIDFLFKGKVIPVEASSDETAFLLYFKKEFNWEYINRIEESKKANPEITNVWKSILTFYKRFYSEISINDFKNIQDIRIKEYSRPKTENGKVTMIKNFYLETTGINMEEILLVNVVDKNRTSCNNIPETYNYDGLIAAKQKIISEILNTLGPAIGLLPANFALLSNTMLETGFLTPISDTGHKIREPNDAFLRMSFKNPIQSLTEAAINGTKLQFSSHTTNVIMGQEPKYIGTGRDPMILNEEFLKAHQKESEEDYI